MLRSQEPQQAETLQAALSETAKAEPILRIKGFIRTADPAHAVLVQGVRTRVAIVPNAVNNSCRESEVVFIGYHPSRSHVAALLSELTGTVWK